MEWQYPPEELSNHVILCNASSQVRRIVEELHSPTVGDRPDVVLVLQDDALWQEHPEWHPPQEGEFIREHFFVLRCAGGAASSANLRRAGLCAARAAVILADPRQEELADARSTLVALTIERIRPEVHTVMELTSSTNRAHLENTDVNEIVCVGDLAEKLIAQSCINPGVKTIFANLLTTAHGTCRFFTSPLPPSLWGRTYRNLVRRAILGRTPYVICGFLLHNPAPPAEEGSCAEAQGAAELPPHTLVLNPRGGWEPGKDTALGEGDHLVLLAHELPDLELMSAL
ncbi:MAG: hypothetical protein RBU30_07020 [Polyangia bacterium]|jgi:hypothetical protein|nr:hypothetical protein [Polyangia bacterium]